MLLLWKDDLVIWGLLCVVGADILFRPYLNPVKYTPVDSNDYHRLK